MSLRHIILCILMTAVIAPARSQNAAGSYGLMDNLTLTYDGNQLAGISEAAPDYDFTGSFEYKRLNGSQYVNEGRFCVHFLN